MQFSDIVSKIKNNESDYGEIDIDEDYYKRTKLRFDNTIDLTLSDCYKLFASVLGSKVKIDCYLTAVAIYEYAPPLPKYLDVKYIQAVNTYQRFVQRKRWYENMKQTDTFITGPKKNISLFNKPLGKLGTYPFPNTFMLNLCLAGLFSDLEDLPEIYRQQNLELFDELNRAYESYCKMGDVNIYDTVVEFLEEWNKNGITKIKQRVLRKRLLNEKGLHPDDVDNTIEDLIGEGRIRVEGLDLWFLG